GGLPLSGVVGRADLMDAPEPGGLGGTYAGNPLACAAALAVLDAFEQENLLERSTRLGAVLRHGLKRLHPAYDPIGDVRGLGCMLAFELVRDRETREPDPELTTAILAKARDLGLIVIRCGIHRNVVRLLPTLVATESDGHRAIEILEDAMRGALSERARR